MLANIFNLLMGLAAIVAMAMMIFAGLRYMLAGVAEVSPDERRATAFEAAKFTLFRAIVGFVIVVAAYLIVNTLIIILSGGDSSIDVFLNPLT